VGPPLGGAEPAISKLLRSHGEADRRLLVGLERGDPDTDHGPLRWDHRPNLPDRVYTVEIASKLPEIVTARLRLRPFRADDLPAFVAYRSAPEVARYQSWDPTYSMADAERLLASQEGVELGQPGVWMQLAATDRDDGALLGDCAVHVRADVPATAEVGVTFAPEHQGRGFASEALAAVMGRLFEDVGMRRIYAEADARNVAVHRLLERLGFRCEGRRAALRVYGILRRDWEAAWCARAKRRE
jgi:RimJ/RimL family protein N-acetyltransferase